MKKEAEATIPREAARKALTSPPAKAGGFTAPPRILNTLTTAVVSGVFGYYMGWDHGHSAGFRDGFDDGLTYGAAFTSVGEAFASYLKEERNE